MIEIMHKVSDDISKKTNLRLPMAKFLSCFLESHMKYFKKTFVIYDKVNVKDKYSTKNYANELINYQNVPLTPNEYI